MQHCSPEQLFANGIFATATVRSNRKDLPVLTRKNSALGRGEFKWRSKDHTNYVQWKDTKLVHVLSTAFDPTEVHEISCKQHDGSSLKVRKQELKV